MPEEMTLFELGQRALAEVDSEAEPPDQFWHGYVACHDRGHKVGYAEGYAEGYAQAQKDIRMALGCKE